MARKDKIPPSQRPERQLTLNLHFFQFKDGSAVDHQDVIKQVQGFVADNIGDLDVANGVTTFPPMFIPIWQDEFASAMLDRLGAAAGKQAVAKLLRAYVREHRPAATITVLESWATRDPEKADASRSLEGQPGVYEVVCLCYESLYEQKVWLAEITGTGSSRTPGPWDLQIDFRQFTFGNYFPQGSN